jgi:cytochrome c553
VVLSWMRRWQSVNHRALLTAASLCLAVIVLSGQQSDGGRIFTSAQAASGRVAYEKTCGRCHTLTLMGRQGNPEERPMVSSLSEADEKFIENYGDRANERTTKVVVGTVRTFHEAAGPGRVIWIAHARAEVPFDLVFDGGLHHGGRAARLRDGRKPLFT